MSNRPCFFCEQTAHIWRIDSHVSMYGVECNICNKYFITESLAAHIDPKNRNHTLLNCLSYNIKNNSKTFPILTAWSFSSEREKLTTNPDVTRINWEYFAAIPVHHNEKINDLMIVFGRIMEFHQPFSAFNLELKDLYETKISDIDELNEWLAILAERKLILINYLQNGAGLKDISIYLTPKGWEEISRLRNHFKSKKAFIAMAFNWGDELIEVKEKYIEAIMQGCKDCDFEANIVTEHHTGPILDKILSEIRAARFVVADFTWNNRGAYFEAGYARALGIPVIHTVMEGHTDGDEKEGKKLHFDIQQINYIKWSTPSELRDRIRDRINAVIT